jgi:hypothetical protein
VDVRLLALVAEAGKAAVHEIAARLGMDPREAASRLIALSSTGLPLIVGVECDPNGIRAAIAGAGGWSNYPPQNGPAGQGGPGGPMNGNLSGPYPAPNSMPNQMPNQSQGVPSGSYPPPPQQQQRGYGAGGVPSGSYPPPGSGPYPAPGSGPYPVQARQQAPGFGPPSGPIPWPANAPGVSTWGPPQSSTWARGDQPPRPQGPPQAARQQGSPQQGSPQQAAQQQAAQHQAPAPQRHTGTVGETLQTEGLDGERIAIDLIEVVDPADFLFTAAGYRLRDGERAVVVHTEMSNLSGVAYQTLPDLYLVLLAADGSTVSKAPVSLSSRPPHRIGVPPGETAGGHTVYVLPEEAGITAVRWSARPDEDKHSLTWTIEN